MVAVDEGLGSQWTALKAALVRRGTVNVHNHSIVRTVVFVSLALVIGLFSWWGPVASGSTNKAPAGKGKFKIVLSLSYTGNDWQNEAANLVKAEAATPPYNNLVDFKEDIAGPDVTKQIQTLNNEIAAGYNAIIVYPISPTALDTTIRKACAAKIIVYAYDSLVREPCAYNVHIDQYQYGKIQAEWLAKYLHGRGNLAVISGVPGTTVDTDRLKGLHDVLARYPNLHITGEANGMWAQAQGKTAFTSIYAAHPNVDGVWAEVGCYAVTQYLLSQHKHILPCAGETTNGHRVYMLPKKEGGVGLPSISIGSPTYSGELAFINSVKILQGQTIPHDTILPLPVVTNTNLGHIGTNPEKGTNVFPPSMVPPGFFTDIWTPLVDQGLQAALHAKSDKIYSAKPCQNVAGCKLQSSLIFDANHSGGN
jgi:ribose transport system substrate-binding protein